MKIQFPEQVDRLSKVSREVYNEMTAKFSPGRAPTLEEVMIIIDEIMKRIGCEGSTDEYSMDYRLSVIEGRMAITPASRTMVSEEMIQCSVIETAGASEVVVFNNPITSSLSGITAKAQGRQTDGTHVGVTISNLSGTGMTLTPALNPCDIDWYAKGKISGTAKSPTIQLGVANNVDNGTPEVVTLYPAFPAPHRYGVFITAVDGVSASVDVDTVKGLDTVSLDPQSNTAEISWEIYEATQ
jgi:hypothetical protein